MFTPHRNHRTAQTVAANFEQSIAEDLPSTARGLRREAAAALRDGDTIGMHSAIRAAVELDEFARGLRGRVPGRGRVVA